MKSLWGNTLHVGRAWVSRVNRTIAYQTAQFLSLTQKNEQPTNTSVWNGMLKNKRIQWIWEKFVGFLRFPIISIEPRYLIHIPFLAKIFSNQVPLFSYLILPSYSHHHNNIPDPSQFRTLHELAKYLEEGSKYLFQRERICRSCKDRSVQTP